MQFLYLLVTFKNHSKDQSISYRTPTPQNSSVFSKPAVIIDSSTWADMESRSPMILSETFIVDENHMRSFLKKVMFWPTHFHMFHLYSYKIALYIQSSTSDLTTSNSDIKKS